MEINDLPRELKAKIIQGTDLSGNTTFWTNFRYDEANKNRTE